MAWKRLTLGGTTLRAIHAPGHTRGATIWMTTVEDTGRRYAVAFFTTTTPNPGVLLFDNPRHSNVVEDTRSTFPRLAAEREPRQILRVRSFALPVKYPVPMDRRPVLVAGGGIGGLSVALTLHQIGVPCLVFESVQHLRPLGVGINLQPNAVRELYELELGSDELDAIGVQTKEWALVGLNGREVYTEPRGLLAGYNWPQYSVHRGGLQMLLYRTVVERLGTGAIQMGMAVTGYRNHVDGRGVCALIEARDGRRMEIEGSLLIGADGLHSAVRAQMHPDQPPIQWGGAIMWRGVTPGIPIRTGASFVGLGTHRHRVVFYPISQPDPATGLAAINWVAEITVDNSGGWTTGDWNRKVDVESFVHHFADWKYDWLDVPAMLKGADAVFEYPMIDRDPVSTWVEGSVALLGDAAHVMYPTGSNGASQAVVDARVLGAAMVEHGVTRAALQAYNAQLCGEISAVILRNRGAGPFGLLNLLDERCGGEFDDIDAVIPPEERQAFMSRYQAAAGFAKDRLNAAPPTIAPGARVRDGERCCDTSSS